MKLLKTCATLMALTISLPLAAGPIDVALAKDIPLGDAQEELESKDHIFSNERFTGIFGD